MNIFTVGSPRVGNPAFAYYVDSTGITYSRSVNNRDIVPHLPPQSFGFLHPGVEAWARSASKVRKYSTRQRSRQKLSKTNLIEKQKYVTVILRPRTVPIQLYPLLAFLTI